MTKRIFTLNASTTPQNICKQDERIIGLKIRVCVSDTVYLTDAENKAYTQGLPISDTTPYDNDTPSGEYWLIIDSGTPLVAIEIDSA